MRATETASAADMDLLPDDALLAVFSFLDLADLLTCRVVCRRWRDLAGHWDAWRHRTISCRHLRLAPPCCYKLDLSGSWEEVGLLAATVACPAKDLEITIRGITAHLALASLVVRHQVTLGRLRIISAYFELTSDDESELDREDFDSFDVFAKELSNGYVSRDLHVTIECTVYYEAFGGLLKKLGAAVKEFRMLEEQVMCYKNNYPPLDLLPNLSRLTTPISVSMECLQKCLSIKELDIWLPFYGLDSDQEDGMEEALESVRTALRNATWITKVTLDYGNKQCYKANPRGLVESLGHSGNSELTYLKIIVSGSHKRQIWNEAHNALPKLVKLEKFVFNKKVVKLGSRCIT
ncbi:F-box/LRR-repeat protein 7 [Frankliniella fusca]|uniref:F-box/LRR-repeat protein 7 n=1 Tax=Frankliniella fusca TaxID=407009 RepID=A0AAE1LCZ7_9NEOP|nr:F-box/LRR-repeat protein 7 [Frankliniella fusca]